MQKAIKPNISQSACLYSLLLYWKTDSLKTDKEIPRLMYKRNPIKPNISQTAGLYSLLLYWWTDRRKNWQIKEKPD